MLGPNVESPTPFSDESAVGVRAEADAQRGDAVPGAGVASLRVGLRLTPTPGHPRVPKRSGARRRRARSAVVSAVVTLILLTAGFSAYVHFHPGFRDPLTAMKREVYAERAAAKPGAQRVVVLGSSRAAAAVEPKALAAAVEAATGRPCVAFNLSVAGAGPIAQNLHVRRLLAEGPAPDVVVVEFLPIGFAWTAKGPHDSGILKPDRLTWDELEIAERYGLRDDIRDRWVEAMVNPWTGFRFQVLVRAKPRWRPPGLAAAGGDADRGLVERDDGWGPWEPATKAVVAQRLAVVKTKYDPYLKAIDFDRPHGEAFRDTIRLLQAAGVKVVVTLMPVSTGYRAFQPPDLEPRIAAYLAGVERDLGVPILDTRGWLPDVAFADGHHVNRDYAGDYTKRLAQDGVGLVVGKD